MTSINIRTTETDILKGVNGHDEWTFQYWLSKELEVATVYELATGLSFPRRGKLWLGLYQELVAIKRMMLKTDGQTLGWYANLWLHSRTR